MKDKLTIGLFVDVFYPMTDGVMMVVSNYAKKSQEEDYAESFAYWYLYSADGSSSDDKHGSAPDNPINRRARYFEELFEKEDDEDDDDEDEKK